MKRWYMKRCIRCLQFKPLSEFYRNKRVKCGLEGHCKECDKQQVREWRKKNPEKVKEYLRQQRLRYPEHKGKYGSSKEYQKRRIERIESRYGIGVATIRRYGLKLALEVYDKFNRKCVECGEKNNLVIHHLDNKGRSYENKGLKPNNKIENLVVVCRKCHGGLHSREYWGNKKSK